MNESFTAPVDPPPRQQTGGITAGRVIPPILGAGWCTVAATMAMLIHSVIVRQYQDVFEQLGGALPLLIRLQVFIANSAMIYYYLLPVVFLITFATLFALVGWLGKPRHSYHAAVLITAFFILLIGVSYLSFQYTIIRMME